MIDFNKKMYAKDRLELVEVLKDLDAVTRFQAKRQRIQDLYQSELEQPGIALITDKFMTDSQIVEKLQNEISELKKTLNEIYPNWFDDTIRDYSDSNDIVSESVCIPIRAAIKERLL